MAKHQRIQCCRVLHVRGCVLRYFELLCLDFVEVVVIANFAMKALKTETMYLSLSPSSSELVRIRISVTSSGPERTSLRLRESSSLVTVLLVMMMVVMVMVMVMVNSWRPWMFRWLWSTNWLPWATLKQIISWSPYFFSDTLVVEPVNSSSLEEPDESGESEVSGDSGDSVTCSVGAGVGVGGV